VKPLQGEKFIIADKNHLHHLNEHEGSFIGFDDSHFHGNFVKIFRVFAKNLKEKVAVSACRIFMLRGDGEKLPCSDFHFRSSESSIFTISFFILRGKFES
jgi:hypothetical protein